MIEGISCCSSVQKKERTTMSLTHLAHMAERRPGLLAGTLSAYQHNHHLDDQGLAARLQCSIEQLVRLKLCQYPRPDQRQHDLEQIATSLHLDAAKLAAVLIHDAPDAS